MFLYHVQIPNSLTSIGAGAFQSTGLSNITIPESVTSIGAAAFWYMTNLDYVTFPNGCSNTKFSGQPFDNQYYASRACLLPEGSGQPTCTTATGLPACSTSSSTNSSSDSGLSTDSIIIIVVVVVTVSLILLAAFLYYRYPHWFKSSSTTSPPLGELENENSNKLTKV